MKSHLTITLKCVVPKSGEGTAAGFIWYMVWINGRLLWTECKEY